MVVTVGVAKPPKLSNSRYTRLGAASLRTYTSDKSLSYITSKRESEMSYRYVQRRPPAVGNVKAYRVCDHTRVLQREALATLVLGPRACPGAFIDLKPET